MKAPKVSWNVRKLAKMTETGSLNFDYPIQRAGGQWDDLQMSLLIHSIASDYPVPPILLMSSKEKKNLDYVLDGKQRITNIVNFVSGVKNPKTSEYPPNAYRLHPDTPALTLPDSGETYEIAGKYFDQLDEDVQAEILGVTMTMARLEDVTDEEIEELFYRWNNGTPLTKQQKSRAKMGTKNATLIDKLQKHPFLTNKASFTKLQRRRSDDETVVLQAMMLMSQNEVESFVADKILQFASDMRDKDISETVQSIQDALDYLDASISNRMSLLKKLHLPMLIVVAKKAYDNDVESSVFADWLDDFSLAINSRTRANSTVKTNYKDFMGSGSVKKNKIYGRLNEMRNHFEGYLKTTMPNLYKEYVEKSKKSSNDAEKEVAVSSNDQNEEVSEELTSETTEETKALNKNIENIESNLSEQEKEYEKIFADVKE